MPSTGRHPSLPSAARRTHGGSVRARSLPPTAGRRPPRRLRIALLVLVGVEAEQLHLDVVGSVELELTGRERRALLAARTDRREFDDDSLVSLDELVHEQLIGSRLELEMLEGIDVERDRQ